MVPLRSDRTGFGAAVLVAIAFFIAIAPTLSWQEFSGGNENLVVGAALEIKRGGPILVPNLQGEPRVAKPPLATWLSTASIRSETFAQLSSTDPSIRGAAFHRLAFEIRWPALAAGCLLLVATYVLGRTLFDPTIGLVAACACGSTVLFLRFSRLATTDIYLSLWVTVANVFLVLALLQGKRWTGWIGVGLALGLAMMSKGPVAFAQTILPFVVFLIFRRIMASRNSAVAPIGAPYEPRERTTVLSAVFAPLLSLGLILAMVSPWVIAVILKDPTAPARWRAEISRENATQFKPDPWYVYFIFLYWIAPTIVWALAGTALAVQQGFALRRRNENGSTLPFEGDPSATSGGILSLMLVIVPIFVMSFAKDKNDRYLVPMIPPAALLAAMAFVSWVRAGRPRNSGSVTARVLHWAMLLLFVTLLPILGATKLVEASGRHLFTANQAALFLCIGLAIWTAGLLLSIRHTYAAIAGTTLLMLFMQFAAMFGYRDMDLGRSEFKPIADAIWEAAPDADVYEFDVPGRTRVHTDLSIYLNRITYKTSDAASLTATERPIALIYSEGRTAEPPKMSDRWKLIADVTNGKRNWRIYLLPAMTRSAAIPAGN